MQDAQDTHTQKENNAEFRQKWRDYLAPVGGH